MIFLPFVYLYVYSMAALGYVLIAVTYVVKWIAGLLLVWIPLELVWRVVNIIL